MFNKIFNSSVALSHFTPVDMYRNTSKTFILCIYPIATNIIHPASYSVLFNSGMCDVYKLQPQIFYDTKLISGNCMVHTKNNKYITLHQMPSIVKFCLLSLTFTAIKTIIPQHAYHSLHIVIKEGS